MGNDNVGFGEMTSEAIQALCLANAPRNPLPRHPWFRRIYLIFFVLTTILILVPFWSLLYIPRGNRPRRSWTLKRCLRVRFSRRLCAVVARCEIDYLGRDLSVDLDPITLTHSHPVTIPPAPRPLLRGHPADMLKQLHSSRGAWNPHFVHRNDRRKVGVWEAWDPKTNLVYGFDTVKAFWFTGEKAAADSPPAAREPGTPVGLHFHGGGYLCGTAAETDLTSTIPKSLAVHSPIHHILSVDYRLAPTAPWPLPLLDAVSAYHYLVSEGVPASDIVVIGDSAGGHLGMALVRWLRDQGQQVGLKMPRGMVMMSPWSDLGFTNAWDNMSHNAESDTIDDTFGPFACALLLRALPASTIHTSEYLSPASFLLASDHKSFDSFPPMYVVYGGAERLVTSIDKLWERLQLARCDATCDRRFVSPDAVHDFMIFPWMADEAAEVYQDLDRWLRELLSNEEGGVRLKTERSPVMRPKRDSGMRMVEDMRDEGISMIDLPPLDLDGEWLSPFTSQFEHGEYDWEDGERWYEGSSPSDSEEETRKDK